MTDRTSQTDAQADALVELAALPLDAKEREAYREALPDLLRLFGRLRHDGIEPSVEPAGLWTPAAEDLS